MRQRNAGPYPLLLPTLDPPVELGPGDEIDHPEPIAGLVPVDGPDDEETDSGEGHGEDATEPVPVRDAEPAAVETGPGPAASAAMSHAGHHVNTDAEEATP